MSRENGSLAERHPLMAPARVIERKRDGERIESAILEAFLAAYMDGSVPDYQMSALLMAIYFNGLDAEEIDVFVRCMLASGTSLDLAYLDAPRVDKHSTGGVGDKVSIALAPLVASLDVFVPMMSGRGLGHTTGTLDKLEAIPGFVTELSLAEAKRVLEEVGCAMFGQSAEIAPLDKRLYALRDVTATVPVRPLIAASIMSKKLAEGLTGLLLDVKVGSGAFLPEVDRAFELAEAMVGIGTTRDLPTVALMTAMDRPLGAAVGNGLETMEAIHCLQGDGPPDLRALVLRQAAEMLMLADSALEPGLAMDRAESALDSGSALERFVRLVEAQGGDAGVVDDPATLATATVRREVRAAQGGTVGCVEPRVLGQAVVALGGGRRRMDQEIDLGVGFEVLARVGDDVGVGDLLAVVHAADAAGADIGEQAIRTAVEVGDGDPGQQRPLVSHIVDRAGVRPA
jgi:pyrimidine-nucleoside phosphorylase